MAHIPGREDPLEKGMATHSSILVWRRASILAWTEEPSGLQSMGLQRVGHDWMTLSLFTWTHVFEPSGSTYVAVFFNSEWYSTTEFMVEPWMQNCEYRGTTEKKGQLCVICAFSLKDSFVLYYFTWVPRDTIFLQKLKSKIKALAVLDSLWRL